jgi:hypothetical protein
MSTSKREMGAMGNELEVAQKELSEYRDRLEALLEQEKPGRENSVWRSDILDHLDEAIALLKDA